MASARLDVPCELEMLVNEQECISQLFYSVNSRMNYSMNIISNPELIANNEWDINLTLINDFLDNDQDMLIISHVTIHLKRHSSIEQTVIVTPTIVIVILILATFWIPFQFSERIFFNAINASIIVMFLMYFGQKSSMIGSNTPFLGNIYLMLTFLFINFENLSFSHILQSYVTFGVLFFDDFNNFGEFFKFFVLFRNAIDDKAIS